jgi:ankyrin repeat protein
MPREYMTKDEIEAVFYTAYDGEIEKIEKFLANGISPNIQNEDGKSLLHVACEDGYFGLLELLLQNGADPNIEDKDGDTPLDYAIFRNYKEFQEMLIIHGAIIRDRQSSVKRNWQMIQEGQGHVRAMQTLLNLINKKDD